MFKKLIRKLTVVIVALVLILGVCFCLAIIPTLPDIDDIEYSNTNKSVLISEEGETVAEIFNENKSYVSFDNIPDNLKNAVVAVEDKRFYKHNGVDILGIIRAAFSNIKSGGISEGASTITQQVVRRLFLTDEQTFTRKLKEAMLAVKFERKYDKDKILEIYLNDIYLGDGTYGVEEASLYYFGKHVKDISLGESCMLAALPQAPSIYAPTTKKGYDLAKKRQEKILKLMLEQGYITNEEYDKTVNEQVKISSTDISSIGTSRFGYRDYTNRAVDEARDIIASYYKKKGLSEEKSIKNADMLIYQGGIQITCSLNVELQENGLKSINSTLEKLTSDENVTSAFVSIDSKTGRVLAYYGGNTSIDMANTPRQPGSTIKPLYIAKAIDSSLITKDTLILDKKVDINGYSPKNSSGKYYGYVPVSEAVARSLNTACVRIFDKMGVSDGVDAVKSYGFTTINSDDYNYAFSLGGLTYGLTPMEMSSAYSTFANFGSRCEPYFVYSIKDSKGEYIYKREKNNADYVISADANEQIVRCLKNAVLFGTGTSAKNSYLTYGKTGTTSNNKDYWFCGITGDMSTAVWIGRTDNKSLKKGSSSWSAKCYASYIKGCSKNVISMINATKAPSEGYKKITVVVNDADTGYFKNYYTSDEVAQITVSNEEVNNFSSISLVKVSVDSTTGMLFDSGKCPKSVKEVRYYISGSEPKEKCIRWHLIDKINSEDEER